MGFEVLDSKTNFVFAKHPAIEGKRLYSELKDRGILVRHFSAKRISDYCRITIGSMQEMTCFVATVSDILKQLGENL